MSHVIDLCSSSLLEGKASQAGSGRFRLHVVGARVAPEGVILQRSPLLIDATWFVELLEMSVEVVVEHKVGRLNSEIRSSQL